MEAEDAQFHCLIIGSRHEELEEWITLNLVGQVQAIQFSMPVPEWILFILAASTSSGPLVPA